jgi:hypothetical protein
VEEEWCRGLNRLNKWTGKELTLSTPATIFWACLPHAINTTPLSGLWTAFPESTPSVVESTGRGFREVITFIMAAVNDSQPRLE